MPCRTYEPHQILAEADKKLQKKMREVNKLTKLLCSACGLLEDTDIFAQFKADSEYRALYSWWKDHQVNDKKKKEKLKAQLFSLQEQSININSKINKIKEDLNEK